MWYKTQKSADGNADVEKSAVQLVSSLPDETLCKLLASREVSRSVQNVNALVKVEQPWMPKAVRISLNIVR